MLPTVLRLLARFTDNPSSSCGRRAHLNDRNPRLVHNWDYWSLTIACGSQPYQCHPHVASAMTTAPADSKRKGKYPHLID
jgi:hypothetical protein